MGVEIEIILFEIKASFRLQLFVDIDAYLHCEGVDGQV